MTLAHTQSADALRSLFEQKPDTDTQVVRRLLADQGARHWKRYAVAFLCMGVVAGATALSAWLIRDIVNLVFVERDLHALWWIVGAIVAIYAAKGGCGYFQATILARIANDIVANVQRRIFNHLLRMDVRYFAENHSTMFITRQAFITNAASSALNSLVTAIGRDFLTLLGLLTVMVIQDPVMSLIALVILPAVAFGVRSLSKRAQGIVAREFQGFSAMLENIAETSRGIRVVKAFRLEQHLRDIQYQAIASFQRASNKMARVGARTSPMMETLGGFAVAGIVLYGGWRVIVHGRTPGEFFSFITAMLLAYEPAKRLARAHVDISAALVGVKMLYDFLRQPQKEPEEERAAALQVTAGRVRFEDVSFGYIADQPVLQGLCFEGRSGQTIALVGRSGAGKSTVMSLLLRYWRPWSGVIRIDGADIESVSRASLRDAIAYVGQDTFLFKGTIRANIAAGRPGATDDDVIAAAKAAYAHDFITRFEKGYDTQCGEQGANLSGGQRQRITIARAFLKNAPILLLDEATSSLDTESEKCIHDALSRLSEGRTTIVIAHRLDTVRKADRIYVIDEGCVVESGTHADLLGQGGVYASLAGEALS